jgi:hypothetical protein
MLDFWPIDGRQFGDVESRIWEQRRNNSKQVQYFSEHINMLLGVLVQGVCNDSFPHCFQEYLMNVAFEEILS